MTLNPCRYRVSISSGSFGCSREMSPSVPGQHPNGWILLGANVSLDSLHTGDRELNVVKDAAVRLGQAGDPSESRSWVQHWSTESSKGGGP